MFEWLGIIKYLPGAKVAIEFVASQLKPEIKWVDRKYGDKHAKEIEVSGYTTRWSSERKLPDRLENEGWEYAYQVQGAKRYILKIKDNPEDQTLIMKRVNNNE